MKRIGYFHSNNNKRHDYLYCIHSRFVCRRVKMLLHYHYHLGHGFGSLFARLFSKVAAKTVARSISRVAKVAGRKAIKAATSSAGRRVIKKLAKKGLEKATDVGTEAFSNKILNPIKKTAINKGLSPDLVHKVSGIVEEGARRGVEKLEKSGIKRLHTSIDSLGPTPQKKKKTRKTKNKKSLSYIIDKA